VEARPFEIVIPRGFSERPIGKGRYLLDQNPGGICAQVLYADPLDRYGVAISHWRWRPRPEWNRPDLFEVIPEILGG